MEADNEAEKARKEFAARRATAVRTAMVEIVREQHEEIIRRARAKLIEQGLTPEQAADEVSDEPTL